MKIFISSTIYDLLDIRAELQDLITSLGMQVSMSDVADSDFQIVPKEHSIENCLINVRNSDFVIFILDRRYGPKLGSLGYNDISATHLEYLEAVNNKKEMLFFVRDRCEADLIVWKKNKNKGMKPGWVDEKQSIDLFNFLEEVKRNSSGFNWVIEFKNAIDLKRVAQKQLKIRNLKSGILKDIKDNKFPLLSVEFLSIPQTGIMGSDTLKCVATIKNVSLTTAFDVKSTWSGEGEKSSKSLHPIFVPTSQMINTFIFKYGIGHMTHRSFLNIEYKTADGVFITEIHEVNIRINGAVEGISDHLWSGIKLVKREMALGLVPDVITLVET